MGNCPSTLFAYSIQGLAFAPPKLAGYAEETATFVHTAGGQRIGVMVLRPSIRAPGARVPNDLILYSHGNAEDMGSAAGYAQWLAENLDSDVLMYDYVNYGHSSAGLMCEVGMYEAVDAVYAYAQEHLGAQRRHLFIMGRSLGTTASVHLASRLGAQQESPYRGLILQSPIASGFRVLFPDPRAVPAGVCMLMDRAFCPVIQDIGGVHRPVLVIHGTEDDVVNIHNAYAVQEMVPSTCVYPPLYIQAGHNDIEALYPGVLADELGRFVRHCKLGDAAAEGKRAT